MAKTSGITSQVQVDDASGTLQDISNDVTQVQLGTPRGLQDVTGLDKSAIERLALLWDGTVTLNLVHDPATNMEYDVFKADPAADPPLRTATFTFPGSASLSMECVRGDYTWNRDQAGYLTKTVTLMLADGTIPSWS